MADNLSLIEQQVDIDIDPAGAPGSILAVNHNAILKDVLNNTGKYVGSPFIAKKNEVIVPTGIFSWNGNAMNNTNQFTITVSKLTADLNDFSSVLDTITTGSVLRFKDYVGRSVFLDYVAHVADQDGNSNDVYNIEVVGRASNPNYIYQDAEQQICIIEVLIKAIGYNEFYGANVAIDKGYKNIFGTYQYDVWLTKAWIAPTLFDQLYTDTVTLGVAHATLDRFDSVVFRNDGNFYVIPGDPATNPFPPDIDDANEVLIVSIRVTANTTSPPTVTDELVLDEGVGEPGEWNGSVTANVTLADNGDASTGVNSTLFSVANLGDDLTLDNLQDKEGSEFSNISFDIKNLNVLSHKLWIRFYFGLSVQVSQKVILQHAAFGYDAFNITDWQTITIPASSFNMSLQYNKLIIQNKRNGSSFRIDNIRIQEGLDPIVPAGHIERTSEIINDGENASNDKKFIEVDSTGASNGEVPTFQNGEFVMQTPGGITAPPVDGDYVDITALIADQNAQLDSFLYYVTDATDDPEINDGWGVYEYLGTILGTLADYRLISQQASEMDTISNMTNAKTTPIDADNLTLWDSVSSQFKKVTWLNIKATLKTYFDTLYNLYSHPNHSGEVTSTGDGATVVGKTTISNKTLVTANKLDHVLIGDASDSDNLKKVLLSDLIDTTKEYGFAVSDESSDLEVDLVVPAYSDYMPYAFELDELFVNIGQEMPTGAKIEVDLKKNGTSVFSTKPTIDISEATTNTASVVQVITTTSFVKGDKIEVFITQIGSTLPGKGLKCKMLQV